jgi:signal transduction histidine kinase
LSQNLVGKSLSKATSLTEEWIDLRLVSAMRLMLVSSALMVTVIDPSGHHRYLNLTYAVLILYTIYSAVFYLLSIRRSRLIPSIIMHWADMCWFVLLIALTDGTNSIFFNFFFFAILVASFGWGYTSGLYLTLVSAVLFTIVGLLLATSSSDFEINRFLLRPIQLLILGYLISRWGGFRIEMRKRLQLLKEVTTLSNPRFAADRTINALLESLRSFYKADACLLVIPGKGESYQLYRVVRGLHATGASPPEIAADAAQLFLLHSPNHVVVYSQDKRSPALLYEVKTGEISLGDPATSSKIASALDAESYLSVPLSIQPSLAGRLYVIGSAQPFDPSGIDFVLQLMDHVTPLIEHIRLIDNLASDAAEQERRRIARDIHDSVIQPYLGLQLGIAALAQKLQAGNTNVLENVEELLDLTNLELVEMRRYVSGLRAGEERSGVLLPSIQRYVERFESVTGIKVDVKAEGKIEVNDRLAGDLFQIVAEGLSNVRRHALCNDASVEMACREGNFLLAIKNQRRVSGNLDVSIDKYPHGNGLFLPRSISERAGSLGGQTEVLIDENNYTVVKVTIPL